MPSFKELIDNSPLKSPSDEDYGIKAPVFGLSFGESAHYAAIDIAAKKKRQSQKEVVISFGGFLGIDLAVATDDLPEGLLLCDINSNQKLFWDKICELAIANESLEDFKTRLCAILHKQTYLEKGTKYLNKYVLKENSKYLCTYLMSESVTEEQKESFLNNIGLDHIVRFAKGIPTDEDKANALRAGEDYLYEMMELSGERLIEFLKYKPFLIFLHLEDFVEGLSLKPEEQLPHILDILKTKMGDLYPFSAHDEVVMDQSWDDLQITDPDKIHAETLLDKKRDPGLCQWIHDPEKYTRFRKMLLEDKVATITLDTLDSDRYRELDRALKTNLYSVRSLHTSNIFTFIYEEREKNEDKGDFYEREIKSPAHNRTETFWENQLSLCNKNTQIAIGVRGMLGRCWYDTEFNNPQIISATYLQSPFKQGSYNKPENSRTWTTSTKATNSGAKEVR